MAESARNVTLSFGEGWGEVKKQKKQNSLLHGFCEPKEAHSKQDI